MGCAILVADEDKTRASGIAEACTSRGLTARTVEHGPAALEASLDEVPDVIVATADLPLIEASKLADILRSNPRTQDVRFLFLGPANQISAQASAFDEVIGLDAEANDVALRVEAMLCRQASIDAVAREVGVDHEVTGKLTQISLVDLLQLFHMNRRTGTVEVVRHEPDGMARRGRICVRDGNVVQAQVGIVEGEKALFRLLSWSDGTFAFIPNRMQGASRITVPTRTLLLEGMRQLDEWNRVRASLPSLDAHARLNLKSSDLPNVVQPLTQEVLLLLEVYTRVGDVIDHCSFPDYQVVRTLQTLIKRRIVELHHEPEPGLGVQGLFTSVQARRLRDWLVAGQARNAPCPDGKLLLVSSADRATEGFLGLLTRLPGMRIHLERQEEGFGADDFVTVGRLAVDTATGIEVLHVPADPAFAPLWPVAAHGALAAVLLLDDASPDSTEALRGPMQALCARPRARTFHVVLMRQSDDPGAAELPEPLASLEERWRLLLPLNDDEDAMDAVRCLLTRVIP